MNVRRQKGRNKRERERRMIKMERKKEIKEEKQIETTLAG